ncbi:hypothetical protein [uncultured Christiangramia sp.]|uniref:hypothetical protein n=1 Tax=uncultured Christiangramia sp. TaxID=503836 RepID=UPI0026142FC1|nr:hypothetical protein [uncultured Christiangramia sp.]
MKTKNKELEQFAFQTKHLEGDNEDFLELLSSHVGHLIFEFNLLEERLTSNIWQMISDRHDSEGVILTHNMNYSAKVDLFDRYSNYVQSIYDNEIKLHSKLISDLKECGRLRNMVVHAEWNTVDPEGYAFVKFRVKKKNITQEFVQLDENSLVKIRNMIITTYNHFDDYDEQYSKLLRS